MRCPGTSPTLTNKGQCFAVGSWIFLLVIVSISFLVFYNGFYVCAKILFFYFNMVPKIIIFERVCHCFKIRWITWSWRGLLHHVTAFVGALWYKLLTNKVGSTCTVWGFILSPEISPKILSSLFSAINCALMSPMHYGRNLSRPSSNESGLTLYFFLAEYLQLSV